MDEELISRVTFEWDSSRYFQKCRDIEGIFHPRNLKLRQFADVAGKKRAVTRMGPGASTTLMEPKASFFSPPFYCLKKQTWKINFMIFRGLWSLPRAPVGAGTGGTGSTSRTRCQLSAKSPREKLNHTEDGVR